MQKLKNLADQGAPGERDNAAKMYQRMVEKHGDLIGEYRVIHHKPDEAFSLLAVKIVQHVLGFIDINQERDKVIFFAPNEEYEKIKNLHSIYARDLLLNLSALVSAYFAINPIGEPLVQTNESEPISNNHCSEEDVSDGPHIEVDSQVEEKETSEGPPITQSDVNAIAYGMLEVMRPAIIE